MFLVVGLGNPGGEYAQTRQNAGFMVVERLQEKYGSGSWQKKFKGELCEARIPGVRDDGKVMLLKPQTFMNLSGECVRPAMDFYKIPAANLLIAHDELDLPMGTVRLKLGGGHGGHNGLRSLHQHVGPEYARLRLGIGKPDGKGDRVVGHVLGGFSKSEREELDFMLVGGADAVLAFLQDGPQKAMNKVNTDPKKK